MLKPTFNVMYVSVCTIRDLHNIFTYSFAQGSSVANEVQLLLIGNFSQYIYLYFPEEKVQILNTVTISKMTAF